MGLEKENLTKRQKRLIKRKKRLEDLAKQNILFCSHHGFYLCGRDVQQHHCYTGSRGKGYCKYVQAEIEGQFYNPFRLVN